jgi:deazaflavin-dependent oxidoreductase (nitroreductase family)
MRSTSDLLRWIYRGAGPNRLGLVLNRVQTWLTAAGIGPERGQTLEVRGRSSGQPRTVPVVVADLGGRRYLVSMLGERAGWVANVRAAQGAATLIARRDREDVRLVEVPVEDRAPILRRYLQLAPGGRPHIPVDRHAPEAAFRDIAPDFPVFAVEPRAA